MSDVGRTTTGLYFRQLLVGPRLRPGRPDGPPDGELRLPHRRPRRPARRSSSIRPTPCRTCSTSSRPTACGSPACWARTTTRITSAGEMAGWSLEGISALLEKVQVPIHLQTEEVPVGRAHHRRRRSTTWSATTAVTSLRSVRSRSSSSTPRATRRGASASWSTAGSSPATRSSSKAAAARIFPGSDPLAMYESIHTRLARVPDDAVLFPGHLYSPDPSQSMGDTRRWNYVFRPRSVEEWMAMFGVR